MIRLPRLTGIVFEADGTVSGADGDRTRDLMHAMHALSQLSYGPWGIGVYFESAPVSRTFFSPSCGRTHANLQPLHHFLQPEAG
jgi:hypothetical protein